MSTPRASELSPPELSAADWTRRMSELALDCTLDDAAEEGERVREAQVLLGLAPLQYRAVIGALPEAEAIEAMLATGAAAAGALAVLGEWAGYMLSRAPGGLSMATVVVRAGREASAEAATPALALIGALARALAEGRFRDDAPTPGDRLN